MEKPPLQLQAAVMAQHAQQAVDAGVKPFRVIVLKRGQFPLHAVQGGIGDVIAVRLDETAQEIHTITDIIDSYLELVEVTAHQPCAPFVGTVKRPLLKQMDETLHLLPITIGLKFQYLCYRCHIIL